MAAKNKIPAAHKGQTVAYVRVSTVDQGTERQTQGEAMAELDIHRIFEDKASGKSSDGRPQLAALLAHVRQGDTVVVHSIDRLARNLRDLQDMVEKLTTKGVEVRFLKEGLTFSADGSSPMSTLMMQMMGAFAQFELAMIRERQREGIAVAKAAGKYTGRKAKLDEGRRVALLAAIDSGKSKAAVAKDFGISRETLYQYLKQAA